MAKPNPSTAPSSRFFMATFISPAVGGQGPIGLKSCTQSKRPPSRQRTKAVIVIEVDHEPHAVLLAIRAVRMGAELWNNRLRARVWIEPVLQLEFLNFRNIALRLCLVGPIRPVSRKRKQQQRQERQDKHRDHSHRNIAFEPARHPTTLSDD